MGCQPVWRPATLEELDADARRLNIEFLPERLPSFGNIVVGENGEVWVSLTEYDLSDGRGQIVIPRDANLGYHRREILGRLQFFDPDWVQSAK